MPYYRTMVKVEILSDGDRPPVFDDLAGIHAEITEGGSSGMVETEGPWEISRDECIERLQNQGSDPGFLVMDYEEEEV